jgi:hypothetical protein
LFWNVTTDLSKINPTKNLTQIIEMNFFG